MLSSWLTVMVHQRDAIVTMKNNNAVINEGVRSLRLKHCAVQMLSEVNAQRTILPAFDGPWLQLVLQGEVYVKSNAGDEVMTLRQGDLLLLTGGSSHWLSTENKPGLFCGSGAANQCNLHADPKTEALEVLSSRILIHHSEERSVFDFLPPMMLVQNGMLRGPDWVVGIGRLMQLELDSSGSGCDAIMDRYLELIFREMFEFATANGSIDEGVLRALPDSRLVAALAAIYKQPDYNWTVELLAETANMSRSLFARRFSQLMKDTPQGFLRRHRLREAVRLLQETDDSIEAVAEAVGYQSRSAFTKAFYRHMHKTPGRFRQSP